MFVLLDIVMTYIHIHVYMYLIYCLQGYLLLGLIAMMVFLTTVYEIPELNLGFFLFLKSDNDDPERMRLTKAPCDLDSSQNYVRQIDDDGYGTRSRGAGADANYDGVPSFPRPLATKTEPADFH